MKNPFELFGLEPNFLLNERELSQKLRSMLQAVHPDRFASAGDQEQLAAMQKTTQINDAYGILKSPVRRAQALLKLKTGMDGAAEITVKDPMFLMQQLELREELEKLSDDKDMNGLLDFSEQIEAMQSEQITAIDSLFNQDALDSDKILAEIHKLQFLRKTLMDTEAAEDKLLD
ncbi:Fe-S protein assembly co-chaperone HscB [Kangiella sp. TOML190]|uniref:Fe-S protein assembly co-chaperone HscB n=1 Tax=Kangiella sp. TOML190 TaxID=2931351 RepID=UPI00203E2DB7|nr:Fe-S protein assembly co-chaperone HscB [Kangiella sp. TOML190]